MTTLIEARLNRRSDTTRARTLLTIQRTEGARRHRIPNYMDHLNRGSSQKSRP